MNGAAIIPEIVAAFPRQFAAAEALRDFAKANRPSAPPTADEAGALILATYVRSSKTFNASLRLAFVGYGAQAGMLNRSLFEDMVIAHWIRRNPTEAPGMFDRHRRYTIDQIREKVVAHGRGEEVATWPELSDEERAELAAEYGRKHHWTQRSLYELLKDVESDWPDGNTDRRMLWQVFDVVHRFNNLVLHHSFFGLGLTAETKETGVAWDVGPSPKHIHGALQGAWFSYAHTLSLVLTGDALDALTQLYNEHLDAFTTVRVIERDPEGGDAASVDEASVTEER
jgi:Family of unknown function (DUF5677)